MFDNLDNNEPNGFIAALFLFPGKAILWIKYMFPAKGELWKSRRQATSPTMTFIVSLVFWMFSLTALVFYVLNPTSHIKQSTIEATIIENKNSIESYQSTNESIKDNINTVSTTIPSWSNKDLDIKNYRNGDQIQYAQTKEEWDYVNDNKIGAWCYYEDNNEVILYNKYAVNDERGLAPIGWHIPNEEEWDITIQSNNTSFLTNSIGGMRKSNGNFKKINEKAYFWISNNKNITFDLSDHDISREGNIISNKGEGFSIRCIKD